MTSSRNYLKSSNRIAGAALTVALLAPSAGFISNASAGPVLAETMTRDIDGDSDAGLIVVPDGTGGVYVVGATPIFAGGEDIVIIKYDSAGAEQWIKLYDGVVTGGYDTPVDAVVDAAGDLYVTAESESLAGDVSPEWVTLKIDATNGSKLWERRFHGSGTFGFALPRDMAMGPGGEIVVTGWSRHDDTLTDFGVVKYDANGTELWSREFSSPGFESDVAEAVAVGSDGSVVITGTYVDDDDRIVGTVKYNSAGDFQWLRTFDASAISSFEDRAQSIVIDASNSVYVAADGLNNFTTGRDFVLLKYDAAGNLLWDRRVTSSTPDIFPTVLLGNDGTVYVSGSISNTSYRLVAYNPAGDQLWNETYPGAIISQSERDHVAIDAQGHVAALVRTVPQPGVGAFTFVRYANDGSIVDETTIAPEGVSRTSTGMAADALGNLFATGWFLPSGHRDILTYKVSIFKPSDLNKDGVVDVSDLFMLLSAFGTDGPGADLAAPTNIVDVADLFQLLANWG